MAHQFGEKIKVLIVDDIPETRDNLRKLLYFESDIEIVGMASNGRQAIEQAQVLQPDIVLMDINMPDMDGIAASQEITTVAPVCQVIMMSVQSEADYLRRSMLAGAMDFLTKPFTSDDLSSSLRRVYEMGSSRRASMPAPPSTAAGAPGDTTAATHRRRQGGKLLLVYSPKGGTGCSTVIANLAIALRKVSSKKIVVMDASLQFGDTGVLFNLQGNRTITDVTARLKDMDSDVLGALLAPHPSDVRVLAAPSVPEVAETISPEDIKTIVTLLRKDFDYILMDTWSFLDDLVLATMETADRLLLVMTPEIPSIKSTKQFFEVAEALQYPLDQIDLILNKVLPRDGIRPEQIEKSLNHSILAQVINDPRAVRQSTNQGLPLIISDANHPISESFVALAEQELALLEPQPAEKPVEKVAPPKQEQKKRTGLFGRLRR